jgi:hypothetical protein
MPLNENFPARIDPNTGEQVNVVQDRGLSTVMLLISTLAG